LQNWRVWKGAELRRANSGEGMMSRSTSSGAVEDYTEREDDWMILVARTDGANLARRIYQRQ